MSGKVDTAYTTVYTTRAVEEKLVYPDGEVTTTVSLKQVPVIALVSVTTVMEEES